MLVIGESGAGKTGALASLLSAGYNVRIVDLDNGAEAILDLVSNEKSKYDKGSASRLSYVTMTEPMRQIQGRIVPAKATVWQNTVGLIEKWTVTDQMIADGKAGVKPCELGSIATWGPNDVLVLDTLSTLGTAAMNFGLQLQGELGKIRTQNEWRRDIGAAQGLLDTFLQLIFDANIRCNVIVNTHIVYAKEDGTLPQAEDMDKRLFGFPSAIGRALSPKIPKYFNHLLLVKRDGNMRRIYTQAPQANINLKSGAPLRVAPQYPIETGLAEYFAAVRGTKP